MTNPTDGLKKPPQQLMAAMERLRSGDHAKALEIAEAAISSSADDAPFHALASLAALRLGAPERAIPHLESLLAIKPEDHASRVNLALALLDTGQQDEAHKIVAGSAKPELARIDGYIHQQNGQIDQAIAAYRRAIDAEPADLASWNNLGNILVQTEDFDGAINAFEHAITLAPAEVSIYLNLADALSTADRIAARLKTLQDALDVAPDNQRVLIELGLTHAKLDNLDEAIAMLERAISAPHMTSDGYVELGMIYESLNRVDDLSDLLGRIDAEKAPAETAFLAAWLARRENRFEDAAALAEKIPDTIHPMRRFHLVGGIADRLDNADGAFAAFTRMNQEAVAASPPLLGPSYRDQITRSTAGWTDEWAQGWAPASVSDKYRDPVFLVGFPRSGTTLLDTMLMGQPELSVLEERPMMARTIKLIGDESVATLSSERIHELRAAYFGFAREFKWDDTRWLVDKHPLNMDRIPTIHRLFPNAKIILAERHPYDVVFSCFMANFQINLAMRSFTTLEEAALTYDAVFSAWERGLELFPVDVHKVRYERLVLDAQGELSPLVDWLELDWNEKLLNHTETARDRGRVRTASYSQIGEQLYSRARYRWRRYASQLAPVIPTLRPWAEKMGYETE